MKILILSTSVRKNSNTFRFSQFLKNEYLQNNEVELIDFQDDDFPIVGKNQLNPHQYTEFQANLIESWNKSDLIFIATPEYNWGLNPNIVNVLHHLGSNSYQDLFHNKVFSIIGVSSGRGGKKPALDLAIIINKIISFLNQYSVVSPKILEVHEISNNVTENFTSSGNKVFEKSVKDFVDYSLNVANKWCNF